MLLVLFLLLLFYCFICINFLTTNIKKMKITKLFKNDRKLMEKIINIFFLGKQKLIDIAREMST